MDACICRYTMTSMNVPDPVMSLAVIPKTRESASNFTKALYRFQREDPTFRVCQVLPATLFIGVAKNHILFVRRLAMHLGQDCFCNCTTASCNRVHDMLLARH